jgi:hypothetical protein
MPVSREVCAAALQELQPVIDAADTPLNVRDSAKHVQAAVQCGSPVNTDALLLVIKYKAQQTVNNRWGK